MNLEEYTNSSKRLLNLNPLNAPNVMYIGCVQQKKQLSKRFALIGLYF